MEYKSIASGEKLPVLGLGTWRIGGGETADYSRDEESIRSIQKGIELGFSHIDTAEYYGNGHCEELVGKAIESFRRNDLFITTKVWHNHLEYDNLIRSMKASLKRLAVDYVDLYLIHWPNENVPIEETMKGLEYCVKEGFTRYIGLSNFSPQLMKDAQQSLKESKLIADQVKYSLVEQTPKDELLPYCVENDIVLIAYSPLARGVLTRDEDNVLSEMAEKYNKTPAQISLNWLIKQENVVTIPKASSLNHMHENLGAVGWRMSDRDYKKLTSSFNK